MLRADAADVVTCRCVVAVLTAELDPAAPIIPSERGVRLGAQYASSTILTWLLAR